MAKKFEYKFIQGDKKDINMDVSELNELGKNGWELVAIVDTHRSGEWPGTKRFGYFLKKEFEGYREN